MGLFADDIGIGRSRIISGRGLTRGGSSRASSALLLLLLFGCGQPELVEDPVPLHGDVPIQYPLRLWDADVEGQTLLRIRITEAGVVDSVEVLETSGYPAFDTAAVRGAIQLRYTPARRNGRRVEVWAKVPIHFTKPSH